MSLENEIAEHRKEPAHLYRITEKIESNDTQENRFLKFALSQITSKYELLKTRIEQVKEVSDATKQELQATYVSLNRLRKNPSSELLGVSRG